VTTPDALDRLAAARPHIATRGAEVLDERERSRLRTSIVSRPSSELSGAHPMWRRPRTWAVLAGGIGVITVAIVYGPRSSDSKGVVPPPLAHPSGQLVVSLKLNATQVVAGDSIKGTLVIHNPGTALNLTRAEDCRPFAAVFLTKGKFRNSPLVAEKCTSSAFDIAHGTTRIPVTVGTRYVQCTDPGFAPSKSRPRCLSFDGPPPLPTGVYKAVVQWYPPVALPTPAPVDVDVATGGNLGRDGLSVPDPVIEWSGGVEENGLWVDDNRDAPTVTVRDNSSVQVDMYVLTANAPTPAIPSDSTFKAEEHSAVWDYAMTEGDDMPLTVPAGTPTSIAWTFVDDAGMEVPSGTYKIIIAVTRDQKAVSWAEADFKITSP
jgi:hypothetical protein